MDLNCFPDEVVEHIFGYLDGVSLANCKMSCKRWNGIISNLECHSTIWKARCLEIKEDVLRELLGNKNPDACFWNEKSKLDNDFWRNIYIKYYRTNYFNKLHDIQRKTFMDGESNISCVSITGNCLITGHSNGKVCIWNSITGQLLNRSTLHYKCVTHIELIDLNNFGNYGTEDLVVEHHHIVTAGNDRIMKIIAIYESDYEVSVSKTLSGRVDCVRVYGNVLSAKCHNGEIYLWEISLQPSNIKEFQFLRSLNLNQPLGIRCHWMTLWNDEIICIDNDLNRYVYDMKESQWISCYPPVVINDDEFSSLRDISVKVCFLFRKSITIFITVNNYICISVDGRNFVTYATSSSMPGYVVCVKVCANLIAFGTSTGRVYLYYFKEDDDLLNLNLESPLWMKKIHDFAIIAIDIWLATHETVLIASSKETVSVITWSSQVPSLLTAK